MIVEFESRILALIGGMVKRASDGELFADGYLRRRLTPAVAELDAGEDHSAKASYVNVTSNLEEIISAGELSSRDQALVKEMWGTLFQKVTQ